MSSLINPIDAEDFDPVQYINDRFPTEASLDDLDEFIADMGAQISGMDEEISRAVQSQSVVGKQASRDIAEAQQSVEDLFEKIGEIKLKASQSESMVQEICADIKKLDNAKNHLQTSITALNRLQMLINAVNQLELLAREYQYREVANLLDAVKQFMSHFEMYLHIPVIAETKKRIDGVRNFLTNHIRKAFRDLAKLVESVAEVEVALSGRADMPQGLRSLADSCVVVDALGPTMRRQLLVEFVTAQLVAYDNSFMLGQEYSGLAHIERRWAWCRRTLKYVESKFGTIFPPHWRVPLRLCLEFTERTKMHLAAVLTEMESRDTMDVHTLLKALQSTLRFQQEMSTERFNLTAELARSKTDEEAMAKARAAEVQMQLKLKKDDKLMYIPTDHQQANAEDESESGFLSLANMVLSGGLSGVFDKFLGCYVSFERQNLEDLIQRLSQEEDSAQAEGDSGGGGGGGSRNGNVFASSTSMFVFIKNSIKRCTQLTTGQTFFALSKEFKVCMQQYVELLRNRCPIGITQMGSAGGEPGHNNVVYRLPAGMETTICHLLNTGEYCAEVVPQLEQMVQAKMTPATLAAKVDFSSEADEFLDLVAFCLKILTSGLMDRLEPAFRVMQSTNWGTMDQVGEESGYLHTCNAVLLEAMPKIRAALSSSYYNNFCTKVATEFLLRYQSIITKQKKISEMATQQLLLDTYNVKTLLLQLHTLGALPGQDEATLSAYQPSMMYTKLVSSKVAHVEMLLKLVGTPEELLLERFRIMWPEGTPSELQMLMTLKGMKRHDQQAILEMLGLSASGATKAKWSSHAAATGGQAAQQAAASAASAASAAAALATSSMKSLTQDMKTSMGNLKWPKN